MIDPPIMSPAKNRKCRKHSWEKITVRHIFKVNFGLGAKNYSFPDMEIYICLKCGRVKNITKQGGQNAKKVMV